MWDDKNTLMLKRLWLEGYSAAKIADRMGGRVTRNAIIGKVHRMGLTRSPAVRVKRKTKSVDDRKTPPRVSLYDRRIMRHDLPALPLPPHVVPNGPLVSFADLEPHHCRAPFGEVGKPGFGFCGCNKVSGTSYCADHLHQFTRSPQVNSSGPMPQGAFIPPKQEEIDEVLS